MKMYKKKGFTQIPNTIIYDKSINDGEFRAFAAFLSFKYGAFGKVFPSQQTIGTKIGRTRETINRYIRQLKKLGYIRTRKRGYSTSNEYYFNSDKNLTNEKKITSLVIKVPYQKLENYHSNNTRDNNTKDNKGIEILRKKMNKLGLKSQ